MPNKVINTIQNIFTGLGFKIVRLETDRVVEEEFGGIYQKCKPYTMTSKENMFALYKAVEYISRSKIPGDLVECGVWKGGSSMVMAYALMKMKDTQRKIYLYDTYEGMAEPNNEDKRVGDHATARSGWETHKKANRNDWCYASMEEVKQNLLSTGYPEKDLAFVKGKVEDTIPQTIPDQISLLRLDTDWYDSTKHELEQLYPRLSKNGVLILDDYGFWAGAKKAVDEYFKDKTHILLNRIDRAARIHIKVAP